MTTDERIAQSVMERFKDQIYRPGDPVPEVSEEITDKRKAILESIEEAHRRNSR